MKKVWIRYGIIGLIIFLCGGYETLDWARVFNKPEPIHADIPYAEATKLMVSFLSAALVWMIGKDGFRKKDTVQLIITFTMIFCADTAFYFGKAAIGITLFGVCQVLLIHRNSRGLLEYIRSGRFKEHKGALILYAIVIIVIDAILITFIFIPLFKGDKIFYLILLYAVFLSISLWVAWANSKISYFPHVNSRLITIGMTFFFLCDNSVGLELALPHSGIFWVIAGSFTWMWYTPALVLIALSGYSYSKT